MTDEELLENWRLAVGEGPIEDVRAMLAKHGAKLATLPFPGGTGLHWAASRGDVEIVKLLLAKEYGFDVNAKEDWKPNPTPLQLCLKRDNPELVRLFLEHGADPNQGRIILGPVAGFPAEKSHALEIIKLLEQYGADIHRTFINYQSPRQELMNALSTAIAWGHNDAAEYLRSRGVVLPAPAPTPKLWWKFW